MSLYTFSVILCFSDLPLFICFLFDLSLSNSRAVVSKLTIILCLQKFKLTDLQWPTVYLQVRVNVTCTLPHILIICNISDEKKTYHPRWSFHIKGASAHDVMVFPASKFSTAWCVRQIPTIPQTFWHPDDILFTYKLPVPWHLCSTTKTSWVQKWKNICGYELWQNSCEV